MCYLLLQAQLCMEHTCTHTYMYIHTHRYAHTYTYTHTITHAYLHVHTHAHTHMHMHTHTHNTHNTSNKASDIWGCTLCMSRANGPGQAGTGMQSPSSRDQVTTSCKTANKATRWVGRRGLGLVGGASGLACTPFQIKSNSFVRGTCEILKQ